MKGPITSLQGRIADPSTVAAGSLAVGVEETPAPNLALRNGREAGRLGPSTGTLVLPGDSRAVRRLSAVAPSPPATSTSCSTPLLREGCRSQQPLQER